MYEAIETAIEALRTRIQEETGKEIPDQNINTWVGSTGQPFKQRYLQQPFQQYNDTIEKLDKDSFLELLKKDCQSWERELKMEVKRAHAVRNQAIRTLRNSSKTDLELSHIPDLRDGSSLHDSQQGSSRAK